MAFIVLEGLDGAGKSTQINLLQKYLDEKGKRYKFLHFPRFDTPGFGEMIARFLRGEFGAVDDVNPYLVALLFAGDRRVAASMIRTWVNEGRIVILDRYVTSNIAYQCAKVKDPEEREKLREWILQMEYEVNSIPQPDLTLFLDVPFGFTEKSLSKNREGDDREYLQGKEDIHEASLDLQQTVREVYLAEAEKDPVFRVISCSGHNGCMLQPEETFAKIEAAIAPLL